MVGPNQSKDTYVGRLHLVGIATLSVLTLGLVLAGWALGPSPSGFVTVPSDLTL